MSANYWKTKSWRKGPVITPTNPVYFLSGSWQLPFYRAACVWFDCQTCELFPRSHSHWNPFIYRSCAVMASCGIETEAIKVVWNVNLSLGDWVTLMMMHWHCNRVTDTYTISKYKILTKQTNKSISTWILNTYQINTSNYKINNWILNTYEIINAYKINKCMNT